MGVYNKTIIPLVLVRINGVSVGLNLEENVRSSFPQGQGRLSVITKCPYLKRVSLRRGSTVSRNETGKILWWGMLEVSW